MSGEAFIFVGKPSSRRYKSSTIILVSRKARSKWWQVQCFGPKGHYRKQDGGCAHTDETVGHLNPERIPADRVRVVGFGGET